VGVWCKLMSWTDDKTIYNVEKLTKGMWNGVQTTHELDQARAIIRKLVSDAERGIPGVDELPQYRIVQKTTSFSVISGDDTGY